jgi:surface antigen
MSIKNMTDQFDFYVDPKHYVFQWTEAMYITVAYSAIKEGDRVVSSIDNITAEPWLIGSIATHGNWMLVSKEMIEAAQDHATKEFNRNGQANEAIMSAIAPYI